MNEEKFIARNHCLKFGLDKNPKSLIYVIREYLLERFGIWDIWDLFPYRWSMYYHDYIKPFFSPRNKRIRKAVPRQYRDITGLIVDINFEFIKAFYEEEYKADIVDWEATEHHKEFSEWLEAAYNYVTKERPNLEHQLTNAYPATDLDDMFEETVDDKGKKVYRMKDDGVPYDVKYAEVNRLEKLINEKDTEILTQLIKRRDYFWT